ncbi:hypothetical protein AAIA72_01205 [Hahella sp. SMD15-11]|uniref:Uncharacterized protein n=1 Tax=Thermohahella caldifontis TaxID=3142973 RepID=A0AB39UX29_9GAMM
MAVKGYWKWPGPNQILGSVDFTPYPHRDSDGFYLACYTKRSVNIFTATCCRNIDWVIFCLGGNAQALLQTEEIEEIASFKKGGFEDYVYTFQSAIFLILVTLCFWALAGLGIFDSIWPTRDSKIWYRSVVGFIFLLSSMTLRECWHVVLGAQQLLLMRFEARKNRK